MPHKFLICVLLILVPQLPNTRAQSPLGKAAHQPQAHGNGPD